MAIRDTQRRKLYRWERYFVERYGGDTPMTLAECMEFINRMSKDCMIETPTVVCGKNKRCATYRHVDNTITLPDWAKKPWVCVHEFAHAVMRHERVASHGPEFANKYIELLAKYVYDDPSQTFIERDANMFGVKTRVRKKRQLINFSFD